MTRTTPKVDLNVELSPTITPSEDQLHEGPPFWIPPLAGEEDPFFDVEPCVVIGGPYAYPTQSAQRRRRPNKNGILLRPKAVADCEVVAGELERVLREAKVASKDEGRPEEAILEDAITDVSEARKRRRKRRG